MGDSHHESSRACQGQNRNSTRSTASPGTHSAGLACAAPVASQSLRSLRVDARHRADSLRSCRAALRYAAAVHRSNASRLGRMRRPRFVSLLRRNAVAPLRAWGLTVEGSKHHGPTVCVKRHWEPVTDRSLTCNDNVRSMGRSRWLSTTVFQHGSNVRFNHGFNHGFDRTVP